MSLAPRLISEKCWVVWQAFLIESDGWLPILWSSILDLSAQFFKTKFFTQSPRKFNYLLSGVPDYFGRNKISSGGDLSHYSSASLY